jgi:hypothetical protein
MLQERYGPSYAGSLTYMLRYLDMPSGTYLLREIYMSNPERVVQIFENREPSFVAQQLSGSLSVREGSCQSRQAG